MATIVREHRPAFVVVDAPLEHAVVDSHEELFSLPWVKRWESNTHFSRWEYSPGHAHGLGYLIASIASGMEKWVVATLERKSPDDVVTHLAYLQPT